MSIDPAIPVASFAWDVLKWVVVPVKRQFGYVISSKSYAQDLQKEVGKLAYEAERIHNAVEVARNNIRMVYSQVTDWHESAEKALKEAGELLGEFEKASKSCCYGTLPDPNCRYQFSRKAKEKIELLQRLARECSEFKDISFSGPAPGNVAAPTPARREGKDVVQSTTAVASAPFASMSIKLKDDGMVQSRELIMQGIMAALTDNNNSVVGIHGMGGVGKSTLLDDAERRIKKAKSFDWVAKADVSENQDIKRIQGEIAHALDLDIKDVEYVNSRAERLRTRLEKEVREKKQVLIILDNLWKGLDLKSVGIPCGHDNKVIGCKLLLTSRFQDVLSRGMGCDRDFLLDALKEEEAKRLFERTVGDKVHHDPFKSLVDEALNKCAGLPFLIIAMANVFRDADFREWKDVLRQIEMSTNRGLSETINEMLQLSYDRFKGEDGKEVKSLLRLCVVYGVSKPSLENLVRYGVGSRLFREDSSMEEVRDRLSSLIRTLKASSFLLEDNEDVDGFKIHDLVRGFVASVASRDDPLLVLKNHDKSVIELPKDKLKSCTSVCFPYVDMEELPEELDCPEMRIFLLFTNNESLKVPGSCFNSMRKLMVLHLSQVENSPSVHHVLQLPSHTEFKMLESLLFNNLINLEKICNNHISSNSFSALKNFCTATMAPSSCASNDHVGTQVAFFNGQQVSIPSLESLKMVGLPNLEDIWTDESPLGLSSLQSLKIAKLEVHVEQESLWNCEIR
ncbi:disease resistance protein At4g27190-like [Rhodamnia argentea]|uniref:Disease resistance protein At4g27190-like n=1 Tax=Rhodamnia argentea TaxID=178133 RepID=A0ABM3HGJ5_9MYRT|nr:disease resistance protein At4g27190-like [Rhodamnia argentea]